MKNSYLLTDDVLIESYRLWWWESYRRVLFVMAGVFALSLPCFILDSARRAAWIFPVMVPVTVCTYYLTERWRGIRNQKSICAEYYNGASPRISFEFGDRIVQLVQGRKNFIDYRQIRRLTENDRLFVVSLPNRMFFTLKKDAFETGSPEEFPDFLKKRCPQQIQHRRKP